MTTTLLKNMKIEKDDISFEAPLVSSPITKNDALQTESSILLPTHSNNLSKSSLPPTEYLKLWPKWDPPPNIENFENSSADQVMKPENNALQPTITTPSAPISNNVTSNSVVEAKNKQSKTFACSICLRTFHYKHVLRNHERTHTGEKPYECHTCGKKFTRDHHLKTHIRLHTGEKPYQCQICGHLFVQVANLRRHFRTHSKDSLVCIFCSQKFSNSNQLHVHLQGHMEILISLPSILTLPGPALKWVTIPIQREPEDLSTSKKYERTNDDSNNSA